MAYTGKKPVDYVDVTKSQSMTVTDNLTVDTNTLYVDSTNNRVGIGTSSPATANGGLHIHDSIYPEIKLTDSASGSAFGDGCLFSFDHPNQYVWNRENGPVIIGANNTEHMRIDASGNVGIGGTTTTGWANKQVVLDAGSNASAAFVMVNDTTGRAGTDGSVITLSGSDMYLIQRESANMIFRTANTERMRIDASGNLLVGGTTAFGAGATTINSTGLVYASRASNKAGQFNRETSDGDVVIFSKDGTTVGSIGSLGVNVYVANPVSGLIFGDNIVGPSNSNGTARDNLVDLGSATRRFDDIYATNGTIQTSDQNEKQQISPLTDAEITAAKAISKLFKTFKWNDSVAENGDNARMHTGVIAQDVQQAMTDAGLDAGNYAFFISTTWWETQTEVPAVEADEENGIEAADAYTRTDTYDTAEEAPEGATERTRLGIRYPELLAFVGAATEQRLSNIEARLATLETN